jgi:hypothetical protein
VLDTSGLKCQIRHFLIDNVKIAEPTGGIGGSTQFGGGAVLVTNNVSNVDGIFDGTFSNGWSYGKITFTGAGDNIHFFAWDMTSNIIDDPFDITIVADALGPHMFGGHNGMPGGIRVHRARGFSQYGVNNEIANITLTTAATRGAVDLKGDTGLVEGSSFIANGFVTNPAPIDGIYIGNAKYTYIGQNDWFITAGHYLWNNQGPSNGGLIIAQRQNVRTGSPSSASLDSGTDLEAGQVPTLWRNSNFVQAGSMSIDGTFTVAQASPQSILNLTLTSSSSSTSFQENGTNKAFLQYIGSTHATVARRGALELIPLAGPVIMYPNGVKSAKFPIGGGVEIVPVTVATLPATPAEGTLIPVTDSNTNTWGAVIAGGGANHVLAYFNGTAWTVAAK